ncbi:hypothetical protein A2976_03895 [candidate division WWE3 bacterium RIFCSPLOWO2_01_FULL_41_9]|uniref:Uncharacterized protein n=1 Tax=candidate division WWE3 bacterium RIFCSPLOWO2_01_FULL_41_9 TaxID=1802626 RepID=A0A1F4VMG9_UNCKA|nr:MAG: hypothetical protein A2976_03895 [candidate division WWE3 bacterium RIFCSPLOWO2_01_FULL_41_9]
MGIKGATPVPVATKIILSFNGSSRLNLPDGPINSTLSPGFKDLRKFEPGPSWETEATTENCDVTR